MGFYDNSNNTNNIFNATNSDDIDLREELNRIIWGEGRGIFLVYRKVQTENQIPKRCVCWNARTQEPDIDTQCRVCKGSGYFFTDYIVRAFKSHSQGYATNRNHKDAGVTEYMYRTYYFEYNTISSQSANNLDIPSTYDKIIELETDVNGTITSPLRQLIKYDIISVDPYRLEAGGRLEYYRIRTRASLEGSYLI